MVDWRSASAEMRFLGIERLSLPVSMSWSIIPVAWLISSGSAREAGCRWSMPGDPSQGDASSFMVGTPVDTAARQSELSLPPSYSADRIESWLIAAMVADRPQRREALGKRHR